MTRLSNISGKSMKVVLGKFTKYINNPDETNHSCDLKNGQVSFDEAYSNLD